MTLQLHSRLPQVGTTIFTRMSALAEQHQALNLAQGFPEFDGPLALRQALADSTLQRSNQYAPMTGLAALREQIAIQIERYQGVTVCPDEWVTVLPGATEALFCAITAVVNPGDEVILFDPCYDSYGPAITLAGGRALHLPLQAPDYHIDWQRVADTLSSRTRLIIINTPHNPTGAVLGDADLRALEQLAVNHGLLVLSDEVYEHLVFDGRQHCGVLQYPGLRERSFAVSSFGKTYSVTGWKTGYCVAPPALTRELRKVHQYVAFVAATPLQHALAEFMQGHPDYPAGLAIFYQSKRDIFCTALSGSRFKLQPSAGSFFQLLDYSAISTESDTSLAQRWTRELGLASIPVSVFYEDGQASQCLRFCFAKHDNTLREAAAILCAI